MCKIIVRDENGCQLVQCCTCRRIYNPHLDELCKHLTSTETTDTELLSR